MTTPSPSSELNRERRWVWLLAIGTMLLTLLPYLFGAALAGERQFMWFAYNLDDSCVYLSWMRQAAEGSFRAYNLFTTEAQSGMAMNPLFLVLGRFASATGLPLIAVYHGARILFGIGLIWIVWRFARLTILDATARRLGLLFVCFSAGFGWLPFWWDTLSVSTPVDRWQPEAITFLSIYLSALFAASLLLQVAILGLLFQAERSQKARYAVLAGGCGFLLGFVHSYDVISVSAVWFVYLLFTIFRREISPARKKQLGLHALIAGLLTAPAIGYVFQQYQTEAVFRARADVATLSSPLGWVLLGYGLTLVLACYAVWLFYRRYSRYVAMKKAKKARQVKPATNHQPPTYRGLRVTQWMTCEDALRLLVIWGVINIAVAYLPGVAFQRKMLQGAHFPIALLAGIGVAYLFRTEVPETLRKSALLVPVVTLSLGLTNIRFVVRDMSNYAINRAQTMQQRPYLETGEIAALNWIKNNTPEGTAIQPLPWVTFAERGGRILVGAYDSSLACFTPGLIRRPVYCGHWGETPDFSGKLNRLSRFALPRATAEERSALLKEMKVGYLVFSQKAQADKIDDRAAEKTAPMFRGLAELPPYLTEVYSNDHATVYRIEYDRLP